MSLEGWIEHMEGFRVLLRELSYVRRQGEGKGTKKRANEGEPTRS
jgi:hypothetical protein